MPTSRGGCKATMKRKMTFYATIRFTSVHSDSYRRRISLKDNSSKLHLHLFSIVIERNNKY